MRAPGSRLIAAAKALFSKSESEAAADAAAVAASKRYWDESVALSLADLVSTTETKASGRVQLLSLGDFREHIGPLWETYAEKILLIAETTVARMIGKGNTFIPQGEDAWLLLFPGLPPVEARIRADAIAARIGEKLVGANFSPDPAPLPLAVALDTKNVLKADGSVDLQALKEAVETARRPRKAAAGAAQTAPPRRPVPEPPKAALRISLVPAWSADTQTTDTFTLQARGDAGEDLIGDPHASYTTAVAQELAKTAHNMIADMEARGLRGRLVLPLSLAQLSGGHAEALRKAIVGIPQRPRLLHLRVVVVRLGNRPSVGDVAVIREALRPLVREVAIAIDPFAPDAQLLALEHIVYAADTALGRGWDDRQLEESLRTLRAKCGKRRLAVSGLRSRAQIGLALRAGADEVSGIGLMAELPQLPKRLSPIPRPDLGMP